MSRIERTFNALKEKGEKALVGFVTAGDPNPEMSMELIRAMCRAGVDILELGIPFSDPTADGPLIQRSSSRALAANVSLDTVLEITARLRNETDVPIILFSYYNPIHAFGTEKFYGKAQAAGADGVLVVDLPPEESDEMTGCWNGGTFCLIRLIAPTTPQPRMKMIAGEAGGFLYMVSKTGVTGSAGLDVSQAQVNIEHLKKITSLPICVGFGVSTAADVSALAAVADGVVIGSAFEKLIEENLEDSDLVTVMEEKVPEFKSATRVSP